LDANNDQHIDKDDPESTIVGILLARRELLFYRKEEELKAPDLSKVENVYLIALVCKCWFWVLGRIIKVIDKPEENWPTILAQGNSLIENLTHRTLAAFSYLTSDFDDLFFIIHRWFWWKCCYEELLKRVNQQDHFLKCDFCDYKATGIVELRKHSETSHSNLSSQIMKYVGKFKRCNYCGVTVPNLTEHQRENHPEVLEWTQQQESAKEAKEVVFPPRAGKAFALSLWKDDELNEAVVCALLAHIWVRREKIPENIRRQRDLKPEVLYPGTIEKAWKAYQRVTAQCEGMVDVHPWPNSLPNERGLLWDAVMEWLYLDSLRQMLGIYGPVLDGKLEEAFDEEIIHSPNSPVRPIGIKNDPYFEESRTLHTKMKATNNRWFNQWKKDGEQPYLAESDAMEETAFNEWREEMELDKDTNLAKLFDAARQDPNPMAGAIVKDLLQGYRQETIAKRYDVDRKTIHNILTRIRANSKSHAK
jgi:hypothetical protein